MKTSKNKNVTNLNSTSWLNDFMDFKNLLICTRRLFMGKKKITKIIALLGVLIISLCNLKNVEIIFASTIMMIVIISWIII